MSRRVWPLARLSWPLALCAAMTLAPAAPGAQVGVKTNRPKREYPREVLNDLRRLHGDRIDTVMICLPWTQWEPEEGKLDLAFIDGDLKTVLDFCADNGVTVVIANHCSFWGKKGVWSVPQWLREKPGFESASSCLMTPSIRRCHISLLKRLIDATRGFRAVVGYNILNEPVAASEWSIVKNKDVFDARWEGVLEICREVRRHADESGASQFITMGNAGGDAAFAQYAWKSTGPHDLTGLWTGVLDRIGAQGITALRESARFYPGRPRIRTEGFLNYAILGATRDTEDFANTKIKWTATGDHAPVLYDYDAVYDYEGDANAAVPDLEAFYPWRIGSPDGSQNSLLFFDHRNDDRPTPYYWALRDLASGVDSFEALAPDVIPANGAASKAFDPTHAAPAVSKRWSGTGRIEVTRAALAPGTDSTIAARVTLAPGQWVARSVVTAHWRDCGVTANDALVFWAKADHDGDVDVTVRVGGEALRAPVSLVGGEWRRYRLPMRAVGLDGERIDSIQSVGFSSRTDEAVAFFVDEFLIRAQ